MSRMTRNPLGLVALYLALAPAALADNNDALIFPMKVFTDMGHLIHVEGTLTGDGVAYPSNTTAVTCYQDRNECELILVAAQGRLVFSLGIPESFTVRVWAKDRIVADFAAPCLTPPSNPAFAKGWQASTSETLIIDRARETVELNEHPCTDAKLYHWTIENPPFWQKQLEKAQ
jgi:hypothetical protein